MGVAVINKEYYQKMVFLVVLFTLLLLNPLGVSSVEGRNFSAGKWELTVNVVDQLGENVGGEEVLVHNHLGETVFVGHTNNGGRVKVDLEQGEYEILVQGQTFLLDINENTVLDTTITTDLPIALKS